MRLLIGLCLCASAWAQFFPFPGPGNPAAAAGGGYGFVQASTSGNDCNVPATTTCTVTFSSSVVSGHLACIVYGAGASDVTGVTASNITFTANPTSYVVFQRMGIYCGKATGAFTVVTLTWTGSQSVSAHGMEFSGPGASPIDTNAGTSGNPATGASTSSLAPAGAGELNIGLSAVNGQPAQTLTTGGATDCSFGTGSGFPLACGWIVNAGSGTQALAWTWSPNTFYTNLISNFK